MNEVEYIKATLNESERLLALAEEASELVQAALKLRRVREGRNPSPTTEQEAAASMIEEYGDVLNCIEVLLTPSQHAEAVQSRLVKRARWVGRSQKNE